MSGLAQSRFEVAGADGATVRAVLHVGPGADARPAALVCHGFKGFKDWGFFPWLSDRLAEAGCAAIRLDFSHNGMGDASDRFERLDLFREDSIGKDLADLDAVLEALRERRFDGAERCDATRLGIVGHSRGGGTAILWAAERAAVRAVAALAPVSSFLRLAPSQIREWRRDGEFTFENARTKQAMPMGVGFLHEIDADPERFSLERACQRLARPLLVVHGDADESVPHFEGEAVAAWAGAHGRLETIAGAGHTFGAVHPFAGPTPALQRAAELLGEFFRAQLGA